MNRPASRFYGVRVVHDDTHRIQLRMPKADYERIRDFAAARGYSLSWFCRTLALQYIAKEERKLGK